MNAVGWGFHLGCIEDSQPEKKQVNIVNYPYFLGLLMLGFLLQVLSNYIP